MKNNAAYTADFADTARAYCAWCEASHSEHTDSQAAYWLSRLYSQALMLEKVGCENSDGLPDIPQKEFDASRSNLAKFFGRYYRVVFDPDHMLNDEPVMGDIGDDLLDTYMDIRRGLVLFDKGESKDALWFWSLMHRVHWGHHAVSALSALHCLTISRGG
jgi:Domain of unknown function (DUF5063)